MAKAAVEGRVNGNKFVDNDFQSCSEGTAETGTAVNHIVSLHVHSGDVIFATVGIQ